MDENQTNNNQTATRISSSSSSSTSSVHKVLRCTSLESSFLGGGLGSSRNKISSSSVCTTTAVNSTINEVSNDALLHDLRNEDLKTVVDSRGMHSNWHSFPSTGERATLPMKHRRHFLSLRNYKFNENEEIAKKAKRDLLKTNLEKAEPVLEKNIKQLAMLKSKKEKLKILSDMLASIERAWSLPSIGRDLAYKLCDVMRNCNGIDLLLTFLSPERQEAQVNYDSEKETKDKSDKSKLKLGKQEWYGGKSFDSELEEIIKKDRQTPQSPLSDPAQSEHEDDVSERDILLNAASVLAQSMTVPNRKYVANYKKGLDIIVSVADRYRDDPDVTRAMLGILECLFKHTEETCTKLINCGGLDAVLYACRYFDVSVLRPCAVALANLALYGDDNCQQSMITKNAPEWLFPLAFSEDDGVKYYAFLAIAALGANKSLEVAVAKSGTLHLVEPFVRIRDPVEFGTSDRAHMHGHAVDWLTRLVPLLSSKRVEVQSLVTFHFAMEAAIRNRQGRLEIFKELDIIDTMKELSKSNIKLPAKFSSKFLEIIGEQPVMVLSPQIMLWNNDDICIWLSENGVKEEVIEEFRRDKIDIDLFLQLNDEELKNDYGMERGIERKKFLRELTKLKQAASYDSSEIVISAIDDFLKSLGPGYRQYVYQMSRSGVESSILRSLTDENLLKDCGVANGVHRLRILEAAKKYSSAVFSPNRNNISSNNNLNSNNNNGNYRFIEKSLDVFISYRRSNGSQLASLLKVHLQLRGFSVFLDIEKLPAGKFDDSLITSIHSSRNFILVLTPNALDRCIGDVDCKDWIHREIVAAMNGGCNIIPVIDNFVFPSAESLPEDIKNISYFNGIRWIHDYQDACVDKLEQFINGTINSFKKNPNHYYRNPLSKASSTCMTTPELMTSSTSALSSSLPMSAEILVTADISNNNNINVNDSNVNVSTATTTTVNEQQKTSPPQHLNVVDAQSTLYSHKQKTVNDKQQQQNNNNNDESNISKNIINNNNDNNNNNNNSNKDSNNKDSNNKGSNSNNDTTKNNNDDNQLMSQSTSTTSLVKTFTINDPDDDDDDVIANISSNDAYSMNVLESSIN